MQDIAPELLEAIRADFAKQVAGNRRIQQILARIDSGDAKLFDVQVFSSDLGRTLGEVLKAHLTPGNLPDGTLYWNIAERVITPMLESNHALVATAADYVQRALNQEMGLSLNPVKTAPPGERIRGLVNNACAASTPEQLAVRLSQPVENCTAGFFDDWVEANAAAMARAGLKTSIIRTTDGNCCEYCTKLAGVYDYDDVPDEIYSRHQNCTCQVMFKSDKILQNVHSKKKIDLQTYKTTLKRR